MESCVIIDVDKKLSSSTNSNSNKKLKSSTTELPEEIINEEILARLPVETLMRWRCVCKSWESLFFTPEFVQAYTKIATNKNSNFQDCLLVHKYQAFMFVPRYKEIRIEPPRPKLSAACNTSLVGSINGLVCLVNKTEIFLWNPIVGRYRGFTIPKEYDVNCYRQGYKYLIGFCWDCRENNYQVVVCYLSSHSRKGAVYSSNTNSWTKLVIPDFLFPSHVFEYASRVEEMTPVTIVKGCPYWCYSKYLPEIRLVKFEVQTQKFRSLPQIDYNLVSGCDYNFANVNDCLAIMTVYRSKSPKTWVGVYILHEKSGSGVWNRNKMYNIRSPQSNLQIWSPLQGFKFGNEIVFQSEDKVICYDPKSYEIKDVVGSNNYCHVLGCFNYTASLILLQGMKRVQSRTIEEFVGSHQSQ